MTILSLSFLTHKHSVTPHEVDQLTGNLSELSKWQQAFFKSLEDCSKWVDLASEQLWSDVMWCTLVTIIHPQSNLVVSDIKFIFPYYFCRLPVPQQNMGTIFLKVSQEVNGHLRPLIPLLFRSLSLPPSCVCVWYLCLQMEALYSTYCSNHPKAVAVLTENSYVKVTKNLKKVFKSFFFHSVIQGQAVCIHGI